MAIFGDLDPATAMGLLQMSGALGTPVRQGGGVGPGFAAFGQGYQAQQQAATRRALMEAQIQETLAQAEQRKAMANAKEDKGFVMLPTGHVISTKDFSVLFDPNATKPKPEPKAPAAGMVLGPDGKWMMDPAYVAHQENMARLQSPTTYREDNRGNLYR